MYKEMFYTEDLNNSTEEVVFEELHKLILNKDIDFCQCEICIQDIAAIVLNKVKSLYQCSFLEQINPREQHVTEVDRVRTHAASAIRDAIDMVQQNAHH